MFVGDRLWIFNYPNRLPPSQTQQWMKNISQLANVNQIDRNAFRIPKPDIPPFLVPPSTSYPENRVFNLERGFMAGNLNVKVPQRLLPREVYNNMASAQRNMDIYKNNILNHVSPPQDNVDHLRRLEENFSI